MGIIRKLCGLTVFTVTCLLVKSHPIMDHGDREGETDHLNHLSLSRSLSAVVAAATGKNDPSSSDNPAMMWGSLLLTVVITTALVLVLALCTCGKKSNRSSASPEPEVNEEEINVDATPVGNGYMYMTPWGRQKISVAPSSSVAMTIDQPPTSQSPSPEINREGLQPISPTNICVLNSPPSPNFDMSDIPYADAPSVSPINGPTRGATINRRLPQLPQSPPPAVPDGDEKEPDYDQTYDVIPDKRKDTTPTDTYDKGGGYERLRDTSASAVLMPKEDGREGPYAKVNGSRKKKAAVEECIDPNYNSIEETRGATGGSMSPPGDLDSDGHYACVGGDTVELKDDAYVRVKDRSREVIDRANGYARVRDVQNMPISPTSEVSVETVMTQMSPVPDHRGEENETDANDDDDVPPAVPEKLPDLEDEADLPVSPSNQLQRLPSVGSSSGLSAHLDRTSPVAPASPQLSNSQAGLAASIAAGAAAADTLEQGSTPQPTNTQLKEKPYTQVSARESLEFVRARQQLEHTARTAAHYEFVNENENDYDGIYETVNEGQMSPQPERPPPLPNNRQLQAAASTAPWQQAPIARPALYEEIHENDRLQPQGAAVAVAVAEDDDEMQPYAVTQNTTGTSRPSNLTAQRSALNNATGVMYAQVEKDRGGLIKSSELYSQVKRSPSSSVRMGNLDNRPKVEGPESPPSIVASTALSPNKQDDFDGLYAKVQKQPSIDKPQRQPSVVDSHMIVQSSPEAVGPDLSYQSIDEVMNDDDAGNGAIVTGMIHISQHSGSQHMWKRKEHTYQAVDEKNAKKGKKDKKEKKEKKDHQNNRTPSPQPQADPWKLRIGQHAAYEEVNVNNAPVSPGNDNANKQLRSCNNSKEQGKINGLGNQDIRARTNSREQVNGTSQLESRSRTNSREPGGTNGSVTQDIRIITGPQENGNNNCNQSNYFWPGYVQETRL